MTESTIIAISFSIYILLMFGIGIYAYLKTDDLEDYLIGGRKMNFFVTALSACASDMSGWLIMGLPGAIFVAGLYEAWIAVALFIGIAMNWQFVAKPLRIRSEQLGAITISEYFEKRFNDRSGTLRLITAVVILVFFFIYTISGLVAGGKLFNSVFGVDYRVAVLVSGLAVVLYTSVGGFIAVSWTDMIQGLLMISALILVPVFALKTGEFSGGSAASAWSWVQHRGTGDTLTLLTLCSTFGWGLGYFGMPHILTRFMAIDSPDSIRKAKITAILWSLFSLSAAVMVGVSGIAALGEVSADFDSERVFISLIQLFFHPVPASICLAAILAAIMSTADSQLLVCTSVITEDIYRTFFRREATEKELVHVGRIAVLVIAALAMGFAMDPNSKVMDLVSYAWAGFGAAFGPAMLFSLYRERMTGRAAVVGILAGFFTVIVWKNLSGGLFDLYEILPGFVFSSLSILGVDHFSLKGKTSDA